MRDNVCCDFAIRHWCCLKESGRCF